ncbi:MAG: ABC transporter substrate-binding protein [Actinomycetota bacterium]|nr:ABC transporter substrate-binding protein [Actinomycetota bacterium]
MRRALVLLAVALTSALVLAGCSTTAPNSGAPNSGAQTARSESLITDFGVTRAEITLGALTDYSGPFKDLALGAVHGHQRWVNETNAVGGICARKIKLDIRDYGDNTGKARTQYADLEPKVLGFMHILGSSVNKALSQSMIENETTVVALSKSSELLNNPYIIIPATTYDLEMINGLSDLMGDGKIRDGDAIGHIWLDDEYGANGLRGAQHFAQLHNLTLRNAKVTATDLDMRDIVAAFAGEPRVTAIALSTTPEQTASAAMVNQQLGLNVPMIGNSPVFTPQLLTGPAAGALGNLSVMASSVPFSSDVPKARHVAGAYQQAGYEELPNIAVPYGYAIGEIWGQLLKRACTNGNMSRAGIQEALRQSTSITTDELIVDLDFAQPGAPAAREIYVSVPDAGVPGGLRQVKPRFVALEAQTYVAPHQRGD